MTYTDQHTKASPSRWVGGYVWRTEKTAKGHETPDWCRLSSRMTDERFEAVKVVALALDKMTK